MSRSTDMATNEKELVKRLIQGDEDAFCELYAAYKNRLIYFAMYFLRSRQYAEDVFQDAFATIWYGRGMIDPDVSFSSYLYTIVRNHVLNQLRRREIEDAFYKQLLWDEVGEDNDTYRQIFSDDLRNLLTEAISQLTVRQREIFEMSRNRLMSHKEIAEELGISVSAVSNSISTSLTIIRTYLSKHSVVGTEIILLLLCLGSW